MKTNNLLITQGVILEDELDPTILVDELLKGQEIYRNPKDDRKDKR